MYFDENLILDIRLNTLKDHVDKFVIVEAKRTHSGNEKKINFKIENFPKFKDRIKYFLIDLPLEVESNKKGWHSSHMRDQFQRNALNKGYENSNDDDLIMISDIDGLFKTDLYQLLEYTKDHDFSCFSCEKNEPASKYQAGITCFANNNQTFKFAQLLSKFIRLKIHLPDGISWMLDQAALFSVIKYLEQDGNFKFNDISENTGLKLTHFFKPYDNQREKLKLMRLGS